MACTRTPDEALPRAAQPLRKPAQPALAPAASGRQHDWHAASNLAQHLEADVKPTKLQRALASRRDRAVHRKDAAQSLSALGGPVVAPRRYNSGGRVHARVRLLSYDTRSSTPHAPSTWRASRRLRRACGESCCRMQPLSIRLGAFCSSQLRCLQLVLTASRNRRQRRHRRAAVVRQPTHAGVCACRRC